MDLTRKKLCAFCGREFLYKNKNKIYCSSSCSYKHFRVNISEETRKKNAERSRKNRESNGYKRALEVRRGDPLYKIKEKARSAVRYAVKIRKIIKPDLCQVCNDKKKLQAHHYMGYENIYDVMWLCHRCHAKEDVKISTTPPLSETVCGSKNALGPKNARKREAL